MNDDLVGPGGIRVRAVRLGDGVLVVARILAHTAGQPEPQPGDEVLIVTRAGMAVAVCRTPSELAEVVDLAELRPE